MVEPKNLILLQTSYRENLYLDVSLQYEILILGITTIVVHGHMYRKYEEEPEFIKNKYNSWIIGESKESLEKRIADCKYSLSLEKLLNESP